jgi:hypothetical protein
VCGPLAKAVKGERWAVGVQALDLAAVRRQIRTGFSKSLPCGDPLPACDDDAIWGNHGPVAGDAQSPMIADALRSVSRFRPQTVIAALIWRQCRGTAHPGTSSSRPERLLAAASGHTRLVALPAEAAARLQQAPPCRWCRGVQRRVQRAADMM